MDSRHRFPFPLFYGSMAFAAGLIVIACGGGGGGGGGSSDGLPVAPDPVCRSITSQVALPSAAQFRQMFGPNVIVPDSTIPHEGKIAHTNFLIRADSIASTRLPDPTGFDPSDISKAYNFAPGGSGAIAIVDANNWPSALNDFNVFANQYGLPTEPSSDVTASSNAVFQVVYATGAKPPNDGSWSQEMALDTEWAHAMAPNAKIYLVEAGSSSADDLHVAINVAKKLPGVKQVSLSFGIIESECDYALYDAGMTQSGVTFFASSGDDAGHRDFPGTSKNVISVGGTHLVVNLDGSWKSETVWNGTACGPSIFEPRPSFQNVVFDLVGKYRGAADIAAVGDPNTGVNVYDSTPSGGSSGWMVFGGTSVSAPVIAAMANSAGVGHTSSRDQNDTLYAGIGSANFHDVTSGSASGFSALTGWDFPTGVGTPHGLGGF